MDARRNIFEYRPRQGLAVNRVRSEFSEGDDIQDIIDKESETETIKSVLQHRCILTFVYFGHSFLLFIYETVYFHFLPIICFLVQFLYLEVVHDYKDSKNSTKT